MVEGVQQVPVLVGTFFNCSPCLLQAKPGSTAMRLVVDYG